jgi:tetratricopeptide (TPR) repeat protein
MSVPQLDWQQREAYAAALNNEGNSRLARNDLAGAAQCYREALAWTPDCPFTLYNLAKSLVNLGRDSEAEEVYRRVLSLKPDYSEAHNNLGSVLERLGREHEAGTCFREAIRCKPDNAVAHMNLGHALAVQGELEEARASIRRAISLRPDYAEARTELGSMLLLSGRFEHGWAEWEWRWLTEGFRRYPRARTLLDGTAVILDQLRPPRYCSANLCADCRLAVEWNFSSAP